MRTRLKITAAVTALTLALMVGFGCESEPIVVRSGWDTLDPAIANPFGRRKEDIEAEKLPPGVDGDTQWAIATDQYTGVSHREIATQRVEQLRRATGMPLFWVDDEGSRSTVYYGRFPSAQDPAGREAMAKLRQLNGRSDVRFGTLMFAPLIVPGAATDSTIAKYDLRRVANQGAYSLQIGYYEGEDAERKKAAEKAVAALRADDVEAYFYHGPNRSLVTVGVFSENVIGTLQGDGRRIDTAYSAEVQELQKKYPHNLANGATIEETRGDVQTSQQSFLVRMPR